ncbi:class I SAM-dependent methyltransferase [Oenococcus alcoholitolerans]|uniref:class I SAM-dependent methyltransferase n=1 Tax=Oenococcus alcoholitolerans TaxID=931074 RepID=UPI003F6F75B8
MEKDYSVFAKFYDELFDEELYKDWLLFVKTNSSDKKSLLDLAGGSGRLACLLAKNGYQVSLLDISSQMLSIAEEHADEQNLKINFYQDDMTDFFLNESFQTITCFADSINYLPDKVSVKKTFARVFDHLAAKGKFLFDIVTSHQINVGYRNFMYNNDDDPEKIFVWSSFPGEEKNSVDHDLKFFIYDKKLDAFRLYREVHHQISYPIEFYQRTLLEAGFKNIKISADFGRSKVKTNTDRVFFIAEK